MTFGDQAMLPSDSPFPCQWVGLSLEDVGLEDERPDVGTYGKYDFARLPSLPFEMKGDFQWLATAPRHDGHAIAYGPEDSPTTNEPLKKLRSACKKLGLPVPKTFVKFMETPSLHCRIRSNTDCFLDLCPEAIPSPSGEGYLIRFLADSQGCVYWYLFLTKDGADHAVVCSSGYYGSPEEDFQGEAPDPNDPDIVFNAESFESFMCRMWLENEIWFANWKSKPIPKVDQQYIERYRRRK